jgi:hypothetical protein
MEQWADGVFVSDMDQMFAAMGQCSFIKQILELNHESLTEGLTDDDAT